MFIPLLVLALQGSAAASAWTIRVEEPTGLYRRADEVVSVSLGRLDDRRGGFVVVDSTNRELPWQISGDSLLFPASAIPGELPEYQVRCCTGGAAPRFRNEILARRLGTNRVEIGNGRFRVILATDIAAIVEAYSLTAGPQRSLNYVETTPENPDALRNDIHAGSRMTAATATDAGGHNLGWTTLGGTGPVTDVQFLETGPLRGKIRLVRRNETWELTWTAGSPALVWSASRGFHFAAVSAEPYLPFDRCVHGSEHEWPSGPEEGEPPDHGIGARPWKKLPGGHIVYYRRSENYGALGIVALDPDLDWTGAGSRRVLASKSAGETRVALTFPRWSGDETVFEARRENRVLRQPLLVSVAGGPDSPGEVIRVAEREPEVEIRQGNVSITPWEQDSVSLDGEWDLAFSEKGAGFPKEGWRGVRVPGSAHIQWLDPAIIFTREAEWVSSKEWWYRRSFEVPARFEGKRLRLHFEATDYYADTWVNGRNVGRHEGYIDPYEYDVTDLIRPGAKNEIQVRLWTPVHYYWKHRPYTIKGSYGAVDQKPDDITALGITRSVRLTASEGPVIRDLAVDTRLGSSGAEVEVGIQSDGVLEGHRWELTLSPRNFDSGEVVQVLSVASTRTDKLVIPVRNPRLWWTWDHGRPNLYTLAVRLIDAGGRAVDGRNVPVGIREIEKIGWNFYLNRRRMFVRGTNYYYNLFLSEMNRPKYERDLELMLRMNVNMIRLHCHFTNPEFYDLADERGVLLWQDYLEAWYPHDTEFSLRAAALYDNHIRYVRNHPSIALWATSDEEDLENYRDLTKHLAPRPAFLDPQRRPVVRSTGRYGDAHVYHGWYGGSIWEYANMTESFVSELGATSLPNYDSLVKFMGEYWPIRNFPDEWTWRRLQIPEAMRAWGDPGDLSMKDYIPRTQAYVARLFQLALERQRRRTGEGAGGILHFHAIDIWPSVTMAAIDFERTPTKVFDVVRRSFAPVAALFEYDRDRWQSGEVFHCRIWAANDLWDPFSDGSIQWRIVDAEGKNAASGLIPTTIAADSSRMLDEVRWNAGAPGNYELRAVVRNSNGEVLSENVFEFEVTRFPPPLHP